MVYLCYDGCMPAKTRTRKGRPAHTDDPPVPFATTLPKSVVRTLNALHDQVKRPRSEIIAKALQLYAQTHHLLKP
jgi:hypothetical protein